MSQQRILLKKQVKSIRRLTGDVYVLSFKRDFSFRAGQVIAIDIEPDGQPRLYSIASGISDPDIEILFDEKPNGKLTPRLSKLKAGDYIYASEPFGTFSSDDNPAYWIATGTGIAPFVSMIRSGLRKNKTVVQGAKNDESFYLSENFEVLSNENYIRCCSQQSDTVHYKGRLTEWLKGKELSVNVNYYLCGSADMIIMVRDLLISKGIPFKNIISETYF